MKLPLFPLLVVFGILAFVTLALAACRAVIVRFKVDDCLHLADEDTGLIRQQQQAEKRLRVLDALGVPMTVLTALSGLAAYAAWWMGA